MAQGDMGSSAGGRRPPQTGRNGQGKRQDEVRRLLDEATPRAIQLMIDTMLDPETPLKMRLDCAQEILCRVYGKSAQLIDTDVQGTIEIVLGRAEEYAG